MEQSAKGEPEHEDRAAENSGWQRAIRDARAGMSGNDPGMSEDWPGPGASPGSEGAEEGLIDCGPSGGVGPLEVWRIGLLAGLLALITGLIVGIISVARARGFGVAPVLADSALHLQGLIICFSAGTAILGSLLYSALDISVPVLRRLNSNLLITIALCALAVLITLGLNWAILTYRVPQHLALIVGLAQIAAACAYVSLVYPLSGSTAVGLGGRLMLRSGALWLVVGAVAQTSWISARVLLDSPRALWFLERPVIEIGLIGFLGFTSLGAILIAVPIVSLHRDLIRALLRLYQIANGLVLVWGISQAWSVRYPGGYHDLVLALAGIGILVSFTVLAGSSGILSRWQAAERSREDHARRREIALAATAVCLLLGGATLFAVTATVNVITRGVRGSELLTSVLLTLGVALVSVVIVAVMAQWMVPRVSRLSELALSVTVGATMVAVLLWLLSLPVERSLIGFLIGAECLIVAGLIGLGFCIWLDGTAEQPTAQ